MGAGEHGESLLVREAGRARGRRWALRWLSAGSSGDHREQLRADLLDLACCALPAIVLPARFGVEEATGRGFLLRPYVDGAEIHLAARGATPRQVLRLLAASVEALSGLHRAGFYHGNLKPSNLIVPRGALCARRPGVPRVVLCDAAWWRDGAEEARGRDLEALGKLFDPLLARGLGPGSEERREPAGDLLRDLERVLGKLLSARSRRGNGGAEEILDDLRRLLGAGSARPLPAPDRFHGRGEELSQAAAHLAGQGPRLLAVSGEAGSGKSFLLRRLALEAQLLGHFTVSVQCYG
ncbi:MAG: hypothetical protein ACRD2T_00925, partial [Thermoanaerobaculia bacterium]